MLLVNPVSLGVHEGRDVITFAGSLVTSNASFRACLIRAFRVGHVFLVK